MYKVELAEAIDPPWLHMEPLRVGNVPPTLPGADIFLLVLREDTPYLRVDLFGPAYLREDSEIHWDHFGITGDIMAVSHEKGFTIIDLVERTIREEIDSFHNLGVFQGDGFALLYSIGELVMNELHPPQAAGYHYYNTQITSAPRGGELHPPSINQEGKAKWKQDLFGEGRVLSIDEKTIAVEIDEYHTGECQSVNFEISIETGMRVSGRRPSAQ